MPNPSSTLSWIVAALCAVISTTGCQTQKTAASSPPARTGAAIASAPGETTSSRTPLRFKAGAPAPFTDSAGNVWQSDQGFDGGDTIGRDSSTEISNTKTPGLFLSEHYGMNSFSCKIPNGRYTASLYFAETFDGITGPGQRVFSFNVQGHEFKDFDVWVKAGGPNRAYTVTVPVEITNGVFKIDFSPQVENPEINAIEIIPQN